MDDPDAERLSFLGRRLPSWIELRTVVVEPGHRLAFDQADWRDAIVVVERGALELECRGGSRRRFVRGDLLWLDGLPLRALHNPGRAPAVLTVVARGGHR
jgi:quercetin dioxygenase-like cupin family protein